MLRPKAAKIELSMLDIDELDKMEAEKRVSQSSKPADKTFKPVRTSLQEMSPESRRRQKAIRIGVTTTH